MSDVHIVHLTSVHKRQDTRVFVKQCSSLAKTFGKVTLVVADGLGNEVKNNVNIIDLGKPANKFVRLAFTSLKIFRVALSLKADLYQYHDPELTPIALMLRALGKKVVYDVHEDVPKQVLRKFWIPFYVAKPLSFIVTIAESIAARILSGVITVTPHIAQRFSKNNVALVRNYPDLEEFSELQDIAFEDKEVGSLIYVGAITKERGIMQMVDALENTPDHVRLHLIGPFFPTALEQEVRARKGWQKVVYYGWQDRDKVVEVMRKCQIGLVTLQPTGDYEVAYPVKMFEYMAAGIAVVSSNFELYQDIVDTAKVGVCVNPESPTEIAHGINSLLSKPDSIIDMGNNGKAAVMENYNWACELKTLQAFYKAILKVKN